MRLRGPYSHSEIVFEPGDGVDHLMPDGTCEPDENGALWSVSSVAAERLPEWSSRRAGHIGGVRFKRIKHDPAKWDTVRLRADALAAAHDARFCDGALYDWQGVAGFLSWLIPHKAERWSCAEFCAELLGVQDAWRLDPCSLHYVSEALHAS